jgi:hypothetical protein
MYKIVQTTIGVFLGLVAFEAAKPFLTIYLMKLMF